MKRILIISLILVVAGLSFLGGRKSTEPEYIDPLSHEVPSRSELNKNIRKKIAAQCEQGYLAGGENFDSEYYGQPDYWQDCRVNGIGDCEDWAIAAVNLFNETYPRLAGRAAVYVGYTRDPQSYEWVYHAIAIVNIGPGYVIDNLESAVYTMEDKKNSYKELTEAKQVGTSFLKLASS